MCFRKSWALKLCNYSLHGTVWIWLNEAASFKITQWGKLFFFYLALQTRSTKWEAKCAVASKYQIRFEQFAKTCSTLTLDIVSLNYVKVFYFLNDQIRQLNCSESTHCMGHLPVKTASLLKWNTDLGLAINAKVFVLNVIKLILAWWRWVMPKNNILNEIMHFGILQTFKHLNFFKCLNRFVHVHGVFTLIRNNYLASTMSVSKKSHAPLDGF